MSLNSLYELLGISKQAVHQYQKRQEVFDERVANLLIEVNELRSEHPGCGVEKMYYTLRPGFIGRDKFVEIFMDLGYRVQRTRNYHRTTIPASHKYPNLIEGMVICGTNVLWQSDITYFNVQGRFYYIVFIVDVFSRKIVGYAVSGHLRAEANIRALKMALKDRPAPRIHHSDRGGQYIDKVYVKLLTTNGCKVSMGLQAQDNAYAERVNGIIKNEYLKHKKIETFASLKYWVAKAVNHYNHNRLHGSLPNRSTPVAFEENKKQHQLVEVVHASKNPNLNENIFIEIENKNELFCVINL